MLGHELWFCAQYFSKKKFGTEVEYGYGDWLKSSGGRTRSPQQREVTKDDEHEGKKGDNKGQSASQNMAEVGVSGGGEEIKHTKSVMEGEGGATGSVGEDWANSRNIAENKGSGGMKKGGGDSGSLILGGRKPCLHERFEVAPKIHAKHVQLCNYGVRPNNSRNPSTWIRLVWLEVGPVGVLKEGAKSILRKRNNLTMGVDGEVEADKNLGKKRKVCEDLTMTEVVGVLQRPC